MLLDVLTINQYVIQVQKDTIVQQLKEHLVHHTLEGCWSITEAKRHHCKLVLAIPGAKRSFEFVMVCHRYLMVAIAKVKFGEHTCSIQALEQVIYPREWIPVQHGVIV